MTIVIRYWPIDIGNSTFSVILTVLLLTIFILIVMMKVLLMTDVGIIDQYWCCCWWRHLLLCCYCSIYSSDDSTWLLMTHSMMTCWRYSVMTDDIDVQWPFVDRWWPVVVLTVMVLLLTFPVTQPVLTFDWPMWLTDGRLDHWPHSVILLLLTFIDIQLTVIFGDRLGPNRFPVDIWWSVSYVDDCPIHCWWLDSVMTTGIYLLFDDPVHCCCQFILLLLMIFCCCHCWYWHWRSLFCYYPIHCYCYSHCVIIQYWWWYCWLTHSLLILLTKVTCWRYWPIVGRRPHSVLAIPIHSLYLLYSVSHSWPDGIDDPVLSIVGDRWPLTHWPWRVDDPLYWYWPLLTHWLILLIVVIPIFDIYSVTVIPFWLLVLLMCSIVSTSFVVIQFIVIVIDGIPLTLLFIRWWAGVDDRVETMTVTAPKFPMETFRK